jgi:ATP-dependent Lhr-like helicase
VTPPDILDELFLPPIGAWFRQALGTPTFVQQQSWPPIARGEHTLLLAPTGSGKTLAAFLACLDQLWRAKSLISNHVPVLYISPLKALNNDIHRNLQLPLAGIAAAAEQLGFPLPELRAALRTGDTSIKDRQALLRKPPQILITTPESLHLLLTSQGRRILSGIRYCILDEIHALCTNKRGVFLSLLLERLEALNPLGFCRIGLSATQRPLDEVARYLGGRDAHHQSRPVTIVDAGLRKHLDLQVLSPVPSFGPLPEKTIWPSIYRLLLDQVHQHRSTIIFGNNRRTVERVTTELNDLARQRHPHPDHLPEGEGERRDLARAHHGSVALEVRQQTEQALKEGRLPAVVATASLELGIDMGAVDLVIQLESPGSVHRGLQRVGRAGHLVGHSSKGRLVPKTLPDLLEQAVLARAMLAGDVEHVRVPVNCLDVLAQQIVAMVACESWEVSKLYGRIRQAYPYQGLSPEAFESVLEMISGRFPSVALRELRARVSWDRVHNTLHALPGSQHLALVNGGTIPDTGQYAAIVRGTKLRIGELDEEFVYERRIGDTFVLGTSAWRIEEIETDRVLVTRAEGAPAMMPFWRGERVARSGHLGKAIGAFLRQLLEKLPSKDCTSWLEAECRLDPPSARNLRDYVQRQLLSAGRVPTDRTFLFEAFRDEIGDWYLAFLSPLGSRFHLTVRLILEARFQRRFGYRPQAAHHDDGVLLRLLDMDEPPLDLLDDLAHEEARKLVLEELGDSAFFAIRFRHNAARALLMPRGRPDRRAPLWLQRLKARSLLQITRQHLNFPIVIETVRECLHDQLALDEMQQFLQDLNDGAIELHRRRAETPSPFASTLLFNFTMGFMYEYDNVDASNQGALGIDRQFLDQVVAPERHGHLLDPRAIHQVERRLRGLYYQPRTADELAEWMRSIGDLTPTMLEGPIPALLQQLEQAGRVCRFSFPGGTVSEPVRWILIEELSLYSSAFDADADGSARQHAAETLLRRFLLAHPLVGLDDVLRWYPFDTDWLAAQLRVWSQRGELVEVLRDDTEPSVQWAIPDNLQQVQRGSLALRRKEVLSCAAPAFAEFLLHWQYRNPETRKEGSDGLRLVLERLRGVPLSAELWESAVLPERVQEFHARLLDDLSSSGGWLCIGLAKDDVAFFERANLDFLLAPAAQLEMEHAPFDQTVLDTLRQRGACFVLDLVKYLNAPPNAIRQALWRLLRQGLVTNDRYDLLRRGEEADLLPEPEDTRPTSLRGLRRARVQRAEGRWSLIHYGMADTTERAIFQARMLLDRFGVVARELADLDASLLPWRVLYEVYSKLEWAGEVRRGYFVEGLGGAQFALPEAVEALNRCTSLSPRNTAPTLLHTQDPASLVGMIAGYAVLPGGRDLGRRAGHWIVLHGGRPLLLVENHGKRVTTVGSPGEVELVDAAKCLRGLLRTPHGMNPRGKVTVEEWNGEKTTTGKVRETLEAAGFVSDYQAMTLFAGW